ncbi:hypothetical protein [Variovorax sp. PCZ-1]|uniref:hypothetical protein n=1 Tax=Variovorax sp. PCZ-1 TaxID=2835533 RepID=UPI001BCFCABA|nr:hypothetical protein [Variovorax sp. PCZ-1]MBS7808628.1 hypothetical protein [Variovorax sp. PCZ-1]
MNLLPTYIVYLDDADHAQRQLSQLLAQPHTKRWVLVACAPRMTRRIGKWLSHSARENWRDKWCDKLFSQFTPRISRTDHVFCEVATGPLPEFTEMLLKDLSNAEVIDARRPKFGIEMQPVMQPAQTAQKPAAPLPSMPLSGNARPAMG